MDLHNLLRNQLEMGWGSQAQAKEVEFTTDYLKNNENNKLIITGESLK